MARRWTDEEKAYVSDVWGEVSVKQIAKEIDRTPLAVVRFAERTKLGGCMLNDNYLTTTVIGEMIGVDSTSVIAWIKKKQLKAKIRTLKKRKVYRVDIEDLKKFLKANPDRWNATNLQDGIFGQAEAWLIDKLAKDREAVERKRGSLWTTLEERRLKDYIAQGYTSKEIAEKMNRTYKSIRRKRQRLNAEEKNNAKNVA